MLTLTAEELCVDEPPPLGRVDPAGESPSSDPHSSLARGSAESRASLSYTLSSSLEHPCVCLMPAYPLSSDLLLAALCSLCAVGVSVLRLSQLFAARFCDTAAHSFSSSLRLAVLSTLLPSRWRAVKELSSLLRLRLSGFSLWCQYLTIQYQSRQGH